MVHVLADADFVLVAVVERLGSLGKGRRSEIGHYVGYRSGDRRQTLGSLEEFSLLLAK